MASPHVVSRPFSRQPSRSMPRYGSPAVKTKPTPSTASWSTLSSRPQCAGSVTEARLDPSGWNGTLDALPSLWTVFQPTHWASSRSSGGIVLALGFNASPLVN